MGAVASHAAAAAAAPVAPRSPIRGPFAWDGRELQKTDRWIRRFTPEHVADIEHALAAIRRAGLPMAAITRTDFPLPAMQAWLAAISEELETGSGVVLLRGLPAERWSEDDQRMILWGIGTHLGDAVSQSKQGGELMGEVRDVGVRLGQATSRGYRSNEHLRFHTDRSDVVALYCVRTAKEGGLSRIVSSVAVHNEILRRRPDLLELLYQDYHHSRQGEEAPGEGPWFARPVFCVRDGWFTSQYSRSFVESAQRFPEVPRLTAAQNEALDMLAEIAEEQCLRMAMEPGDIQLLNNHVTYHSRTGYIDHDAPERQRLLYRLWLSYPKGRPLPEGYREIWGAIETGEIRGGVRAAAGYRTVEEYRRTQLGR
ncbi:MAG: TauD/TfdA family dioxygenase [Alphaproteobacteria bacterium]|nr:TauD/TfdA family dioxygenase [Alphaproteobacteria bacterium]